jgi:peroxiredoxin
LPEFAAVDESGRAVRSSDLHGAAAVILFVRGNWCPFCTRQVADLADRYKEILDLGAKLILITPKPLQTTRRVADIFGVDFDFWLDEDLAITRRLGLYLRSGVPGKYRDDYGADTLWPTSLVVDGKGIIRYTALSRFIADRPNPNTLVTQLKNL